MAVLLLRNQRSGIFLLIASCLVVLLTTQYFEAPTLIRLFQKSQLPYALRSVQERKSSYEELEKHMHGYWTFLDVSLGANNNSMGQDNYFPEEADCIQRHCRPFPACDQKRDSIPRMFTAYLGNQCGCGVTGFKAVSPQWISNASIGHSSPDESSVLPASLRLVRRLQQSNKTLCFVGDSVDKQIAFALHHNLLRFTTSYPGLSVTRWDTPVAVNDTTQAGGNRGWWGGMKDIQENAVHLPEDNNENTSQVVKFKFFKHYVWSPWDVEFIQDECDVIIMNLALHYNDVPPHVGRNSHFLVDDMRAAITFLANFSAQPGRTAIWRSALPQHFNTTNGHYKGGLGNHTCKALTVPLEDQQYNKVHEKVLHEMCQPVDENDRTNFVYSCTTNQTAGDYQSVYKWWAENNYTDRMATQRTHDSIVKGNILLWDIANLFDKPKWHVSNNDCTHFCYIPALFETAFERLTYLL